MTDSEATHIAIQYVSQLGEVLPGFKFGIDNREEFIDKYYYDFIWLTLDGQIPIEPPIAGGARGFTVNKHDKQVELTTHSNYNILKTRERELSEMYQILLDFKAGKNHLSTIRAKFNLNPVQLLKFSKIIKETELNKSELYEIIEQMIGKIKNYR
jgi:hypothetical protein